MADSPGRPNYQHHAGFYRSVNPGNDLSKPWEASPSSSRSLPMSPFRPVFELPRRTNDVSKASLSPPPSNTVIVRDRSLWKRILWFLQSGKASKQSDTTIPQAQPDQTPVSDNAYSERVPLHEWKQYGYWARPYINDVMCQNSPVTSEKTISTRALADLITNMRGAEDPEFDIFPERWIVGAKHRALPPRPTRWKDPDLNAPLPFPWEVQLNPLLHHLLWGPSAFRWCILDDPYEALFYGRTPMNVMCTDADRAQPATWPFLTHMHFNAVLGDDAYKFPWPFTVFNPKGIKVGDILAEIHHNFQVGIRESEFGSWPPFRQLAARRTRQHRLNRWVDVGEPPIVDYLRRCDALGAQMWFRGIEPSVDGGGWMIVFGPY